MNFIMEKGAIFLIDGGYLSFISKFLGGGKPLKYHIDTFAKNISKSKGLICKQIYYYTAPPYQSQNPTEIENQRKSKYDLFISKLKLANPPIIVREGRCQKDNCGGFHQKGVDTLLTMDLLKLAQQKNTDTLILLTSDTDFVPVIKDIQEEHKINVVLAYFTDKRRKSAFSLSNHLWNVCKEKILIRKDHFS